MPAELLTRPDGGAPAFCDLRGRIQADIVAGLPGQFRRMVMPPDQLHDWQRDRLRRLLASAIQRSAFHARRLHGIDPPRFEPADLPSLPVMTKAQMMDHFDDLISDRLLNREAAERALAATHDEPRPLPGGYTCMATGGSSGQRGIFAYDPVSVAEFVSLIFRTRLAALGPLLITNLFNDLQPLIRYELNDSFTRQPDAASHGLMRVTVQGRPDDILCYGQAEIHPLTLRSILLAQPDVLDYQVRQTARGVAVQVLLESGISVAGLREQLCAALARTGLADPEVTVDAVAALSRNPETGKLRRVIPV